MKIISFKPLRMRYRKAPPAPIDIPPLSSMDVPDVPLPTTTTTIVEATEPIHIPERKVIKKKALLIGICRIRQKNEPVKSPLSTQPQTSKLQRVKKKLQQKKKGKSTKHKQPEEEPLKGPHKDVDAVRNLLIDIYNYDPADIMVLIDDDNPDHKQPTKDNIMEEMRRLVEGAQEHDRFFFHFSGHSKQEDTDDIEEEDRKNEFILTSDGDCIKDDVLKATLVEPLPSNSSLIAVFDSCHSGSLLDLKHFRCNRVYVPWTNRGTRRTATRFYFTGPRKHAKILSPRTPLPFHHMKRAAHNWKRTSIDRVMPDSSLHLYENLPSAVHNSLEPVQVTVPLTQKSTIRSTLSVKTDSPKRAFWLDSPGMLERTYSESPVNLYCTGFCRDNPLMMEDNRAVRADVISISSAKDNELAWEGGDGHFSLSQALVRILRNGDTKHPTFHDLLTLVSHDIHSYFVEMHPRARQYKKQVEQINKGLIAKGKNPLLGDNVEMNNFQNPQLSSEKPLDMSRHFYP